MTVQRQELASVRYWQDPPEHTAQRFYIAFCLLMASVQDSILGLKERASDNHNWSAMCSYYSLVHAGRLLSFLALGDYPTHHAVLPNVFRFCADRPANPDRNPSRFPFDWLDRFAARTGGRQPTGGPNTPRPLARGDAFNLVAGYLTQVGVADAPNRLQHLGTVIETARRLRNDSNYEALLIAHEYRHVSISRAFDDLSRHMSLAAEGGVDMAIEAFNAYRQRDPILPLDRSTRDAFLHEYVHDRIGDAIRKKIAGATGAETRLSDVLQRLATETAYASYQSLEERISRDLFEGKANLMEDFERKVMTLARGVRHDAPGGS
jgi:hypothetical protein